MKVSLVQCELKMGEVSENFKIIENKIKEAMFFDPDVIVLPEMWNTSFIPLNVMEISDNEGLEAKRILSKLSKEFNVNIVGGSVSNKLNNKLYNTSYIFDRSGKEIAKYNKVHLFSPSGEDELFERGDKLVTFELDGVKCGMVICYDIRFLEWIRKYALGDIQVLFNSAAWPAKRIMHWDILNRARAIENQMFIVCVNSVGDFGGHSAIIDPWGEYVINPYESNEIKSGELDFGIIKEIRESINVFRDRRPELY
ncbi:MAG: carbon-nitrogen family hydrolase [Peptoniphilus sp.]|uniref:carbon-nitrogen family hydrolase n=1 Tax=Peptoniphilus sp. TaxID=1971214 RepID=UPI0025F0CCB3|nr:carbon-nitrogen family hydrolase [Peptoniphilus sp.]MCI5643695.1 carbon-nitrogen family hydrolase [Peptoniphilus sp.]MDY3902315.1 carbon-nitrogen family hydrolase [Peptoniphilus sp.]